MNAHDLTFVLKGKWRGSSGMARCPCHDDRSPSLSIRDGDVAGRIIFKCFAGCESGNIVAELRRQGLLENPEQYFRPRQKVEISHPDHKPDPAALTAWKAAKPAAGSIVETYLRGRGIGLPVPVSLRATDAPAMIAAVQAPGGTVIAIQTTALTQYATRAGTTIPRLTTGSLGYGAVRLAKAGDVLGLAEGVETALSAMQLAQIPVWASIGAARMHRVAIPDSVRELHIFRDNDEPGRAAADRTANVHALRKVVLRFPPGNVKDWNDFLQARCGRAA